MLVLALLYSCLKKIPRDRNVAALFDDEVCAVKNCQLFLRIVFRISTRNKIIDASKLAMKVTELLASYEVCKIN